MASRISSEALAWLVTMLKSDLTSSLLERGLEVSLRLADDNFPKNQAVKC